tara:strand:- start:191 stop:433 length:243 start_codon:yes stop_codon:yes gene_type:complete
VAGVAVVRGKQVPTPAMLLGKRKQLTAETVFISQSFRHMALLVILQVAEAGATTQTQSQIAVYLLVALGAAVVVAATQQG